MGDPLVCGNFEGVYLPTFSENLTHENFKFFNNLLIGVKNSLFLSLLSSKTQRCNEKFYKLQSVSNTFKSFRCIFFVKDGQKVFDHKSNQQY